MARVTKRARKAARQAKVRALMSPEELRPLPPPPRTALPRTSNLNLPPPCEHCGCIHQGNKEETLATLAKDVLVFYDRDVAAEARVAGLCGPRFRPVDSSADLGIRAHFGFPYAAKGGYAVYRYEARHARWFREIPAVPLLEARQDFADVLVARILSRPRTS